MSNSLGLILTSLTLLVLSSHTAYGLTGGTWSSPRWHWMGSLQYTDGRYPYHHCGCIIISDRWILTAAQCIDEQVPVSLYRVELGVFDIGMPYPGSPEYYGIQSIIRHSAYDPGSCGDGTGACHINDIALIRTNTTINFENGAIDSIELELNTSAERPDEDCLVVGWGAAWPGGGYPSTYLSHIRLDMLYDWECQNMWPNGYDSEHHICGVDRVNMDKTICEKDEGGPIMCKPDWTDDDVEWTLMGIASWATWECSGLFPSVFTKVSAHIGWICEQTAGEVCLNQMK